MARGSPRPIAGNSKQSIGSGHPRVAAIHGGRISNTEFRLFWPEEDLSDDSQQGDPCGSVGEGFTDSHSPLFHESALEKGYLLHAKCA